MKRAISSLLAACCCVAALGEPPTPRDRARAAFSPIQEPRLPDGIEIEFSSDIDLVERTAKLISLAKREVLVSHYAITDLRVLQALAHAGQQGVTVAVVLDRAPAVKNYDTPRYLRSQSVPVFAATRGTSGTGWHNQRYIVIDREAVVITSCDLTSSAKRNSENLVVLHNAAVAARFYNRWLEEAAAGTKIP